VSGWASLTLAIGIVVILAVLWTRLRRPRVQRGAALAPFLRHFDALQIPDDLALTVYHHLERWMEDSGRGFPVGPRDDLSVYGISAEDVDDALALLLAACGRRDTNSPRGPLVTIEDLLRHIASCPPSKPADATPPPTDQS